MTRSGTCSNAVSPSPRNSGVVAMTYLECLSELGTGEAVSTGES